MNVTPDPVLLARLARTRLPVPPRAASPWPDEPPRPGKHYPPANKAHLPSSLSSKVVGLSALGDRYSSAIDEFEDALGAGGVMVRLVGEPLNPVDPCAVYLDWVGPSGDIHKLGYLPAALANRLHSQVADFSVTDIEILRHPDYVDRPGISVTLHRS